MTEQFVGYNKNAAWT